jgi:hypothetical protein
MANQLTLKDLLDGKAMTANPQNKPDGMCKQFLLCRRPATKVLDHPVLGKVPTCDTCAKIVEGK